MSELRRAIGADAISMDATELAIFSRDLFFRGKTPLAIIRPTTTDQLKTAVRILSKERVAMVPRGGGMSYSLGYLPVGRSVLIDTRQLNRILAINTEDRTVRVQAGVTWKQLDAALAEQGLRTPFWGTGSGQFATVGATLSQHALNYGSGQYGASADSVISLTIIAANGEIFETVGAASGAARFFRHYGPDLTGLFLGDCGALGIKAEATLPLLDRPEHLRYAAWELPSAEAFAVALSKLGRTRLVAECFGFDPAFMRLRTTYDGVKTGIETLGKVIASQQSLRAGVKAAVSVATAGTAFLDELGYSIHVTVEGNSKGDADSKLELVNTLLAPHGTAIEASIPKVARSSPFPDPTILVARDGKLWIPVHGIVAHSKLLATIQALQQLMASRRDDLAEQAIDWGVTFVPAGESSILVEPNLYWPDERSDLLGTYLPQDYLDRRTQFADNPSSRETVTEIRRAIVDCFQQLGATHFQIGRYYPYLKNQAPVARALIETLKSHLDPNDLMNPGVLGFGSEKHGELA